MFLSNLKRNSIYVVLLFISSFLVSKLTEDFRYSNYRWVYQIGWVFCYILHFSSLILSFVNSILIVKDIKMSLNEKKICLILSLSTIFFWIYLLYQFSFNVK